MKKYLLMFSALVGFATMAYARGPAPVAPNGTIYPPEYGGFFYSTSNFSVDGGTVTGQSVIYAVNFGSGTTNDYVDIFETTSTVTGSSYTIVTNPNAERVYRIYNVANSTAVTPAAQARGLSPAGSIKVGGKGGWNWKPRDNTNPGITVLFIGGYLWDSGGN